MYYTLHISYSINKKYNLNLKKYENLDCQTHRNCIFHTSFLGHYKSMERVNDGTSQFECHIGWSLALILIKLAELADKG